jgi:hypothetical protein
MCVICYIPKGVPTPPREIIKAMHYANPHGMGMVTPADYYKGMSVEMLLRHLRYRDISQPCLLHFRLATHGSIRRANCHPFYDEESDTWFMHNGILNIEPIGDMTDSETAFRAILAPEIQSHGLCSDDLRYAVKSIIGCSKFAFLQGDDVKLFGEYQRWLGCWFSNLRFR